PLRFLSLVAPSEISPWLIHLPQFLTRKVPAWELETHLPFLKSSLLGRLATLDSTASFQK
ncbi:hypothetical protein LINPERPRIM_LOCUS38615, partial [Linum perenne]